MKNIKISDKDAHALIKAQNRKELVITGNSETIKSFEIIAKEYNKEYLERFGYKQYQIGKLNIKIK